MKKFRSAGACVPAGACYQVAEAEAAKPQELDFDAVFAKLKQIGGKSKGWERVTAAGTRQFVCRGCRFIRDIPPLKYLSG